MVVLRCTQKLLARLKQSGDLPAIESTTRLGDWYGNIVRIGAGQHLLFISERSRLSVIVPLREAKRLGTVFPDAVCGRLAVVGVPAADIAEERARMSEMVFGQTRNRSLLGTNERLRVHGTERRPVAGSARNAGELMSFLAETPILPLKGARPIDLTLAAFGTR
jgi:hypothetical protein